LVYLACPTKHYLGFELLTYSMANTHKVYVLEVFSDQNFVRDIVKGER